MKWGIEVTRFFVFLKFQLKIYDLLNVTMILWRQLTCRSQFYLKTINSFFFVQL